MKRGSGLVAIILAIITLLVLVFKCDSGSRNAPRSESSNKRVFSHGSFDHFLKRYVDDDGRIDYAEALGDHADLDLYRAALALTSPDADPGSFASESQRMAYWLNAYNASVIGLVLDYYPIFSVQNLRRPWYLAMLPDGSAFFMLQRISLGGSRMSLYTLENDVIRERFHDPRVHFAMNCASASCPRLPAEAFVPDRLEEQLNRARDLFINDPRNVKIDTEERVVLLSSIFKWYERDFVDWPQEEFPDDEASLLTYLADNLPGRSAQTIQACVDCRIEFIPYDWSLNDRVGSHEP